MEILEERIVMLTGVRKTPELQFQLTLYIIKT